MRRWDDIKMDLKEMIRRHYRNYVARDCKEWRALLEAEMRGQVDCRLARANLPSARTIYTGCHRRNGPNFGRVFLMLNYTDITQNTYFPS